MNSKHKWFFLFGGVFLCFWISYRLAISKTLTERREYKNFMKQTRMAKNLPDQIAILSAKEKYLDSVLKKKNIDDLSVERNLLKILSKVSDSLDINLTSYAPPHSFSDNGITRTTYRITLRGGFTNILKVLNAFESSGAYGQIVHLDFQKRKKPNEKAFLEAKVFLQIIN